jgi:YHS domain-containing protein
MQVTDPVCGMQIESTKAVATEVVRGRPTIFVPLLDATSFGRAPTGMRRRDDDRCSAAVAREVTTADPTRRMG